jgi:hypothetical protein
MIVFENSLELASAMRTAERFHHEYEQNGGDNHDWASWYADYIWMNKPHTREANWNIADAMAEDSNVTPVGLGVAPPRQTMR